MYIDCVQFFYTIIIIIIELIHRQYITVNIDIYVKYNYMNYIKVSESASIVNYEVTDAACVVRVRTRACCIWARDSDSIVLPLSDVSAFTANSERLTLSLYKHSSACSLSLSDCLCLCSGNKRFDLLYSFAYLLYGQ